MKISIVVPIYNEEDNLKDLVAAVTEVMNGSSDWELILANDGSSDRTLDMANDAAAVNPRIKVVSYDKNRGQGYALQQGFRRAVGDIIVTLDADLSYNPAGIPGLLKPLEEDDFIDIVSGSPYMVGGGVEGVPFHRLFLSRGANRLLGWALPGHLRTVTGMFRAYRAEFLYDMEWDATGKEIHFEILSKGLATGARVVEIPAVLRGRVRGRSTIRLRAAILSHLVFSFFERPAILFEMIGALMLGLGLASGIYIIWLWQHAELDPTRPLMVLMVLLIVLGAVVLSFGFIASQISEVRKQIYRVQKENLDIKRRVEKASRMPDDE